MWEALWRLFIHKHQKWRLLKHEMAGVATVEASEMAAATVTVPAVQAQTSEVATVDKYGFVVSDDSVQTLIYTNDTAVVVDESSVLQAAISRIEQQTERLEMQEGGRGLTLGGGRRGASP